MDATRLVEIAREAFKSSPEPLHQFKHFKVSGPFTAFFILVQPSIMLNFIFILFLNYFVFGVYNNEEVMKKILIARAIIIFIFWVRRVFNTIFHK